MELTRTTLLSVICMALVAVPAALPVWAQSASEDQPHKQRKCDYDVNAECRLGGGPKRQQNRAGAPVDLTGYWVSVVTEDWRWRMKTPPKGDIASLPLNLQGELETEKWSPETDSASCKQFGAPGLLRNPMRVHLHWEDDDTLRLDTDHGMQTRHFHFNGNEVAGGEPSLQGDSIANWQESGLKVITNNLSPGYLRSNGVPYSGGARLTEYYDRITAFGDTWLIVTSIVDDPQFLSREFITSTHFKLLPNGDDWRPLACGKT